jgi:transcriptional regulator with XRE-family HTH domain
MDPASLLRTARRRHGLTQADLARRAGTTQSVISAYERGHRDPTYDTLRRLVEATGERLQLRAVPPEPGVPPARDLAEHAARLLDVLSLADAVPARRRPRFLKGPRLVSR